MDAAHKPVLLQETVDLLALNGPGTWVDGTMGWGGHSRALLDRLNRDAVLVGIDRDGEAVEACRRLFSAESSRVRVIQADFGRIHEVLNELGIDSIRGLLLDLGVSGYQIDTPKRGFSYLVSGPLDMRMDRNSDLSAMEVVNDYSERRLADILYTLGEERASRRLARIIVEERKKGTIKTTGRLAELISAAVPPRWAVKTLSRVFQAIRMEVNGELDALASCLMNVYPYLEHEGRIVVIAWESLSDRMVKRYFRGEWPCYQKNREPEKTGFQFKNIVRLMRPGDEETCRNSRARSARLRCGQKDEGS
ncbi:MAG TPA: 16S rRNA (cytosine(1402)-N(4))-methyltransferase RsmH [bacterium]|nr:16S rRNA (cytosine(1402)-N(4))-methyltransferase RsmH [bacterium]